MQMRNVMTVRRNILLLFWFAVLVSAQARKRCSAPPEYRNDAKLQKKFSTRQWFNDEDKVYYECVGESTPSEGSPGVRCRDGKWGRLTLTCQKQSSTIEQPSMKDGGCRPPQPASGSNAILTDMYITKTSFANGDMVKYQCQVGYVSIGGSRYRSCKNGQWSTQNLRCKPKSCGTAGEIYHGEFIYDGSEFGATATAVCDEGYRLVGRATRNCQDGGWDGRVPACEAVECEDPPATNAEMMDIREFYTYSAVVRYRCRSGTLVGQQSIWCTKDGTWSSPPPKCQVMTCPPPNVANASWRAPHDHHQYRYKETISVACHSGYTMTGPDVITCESDGQWSRLPTCSRAWGETTCPRPAVADSVQTGGEVPAYRVGYRVTVTCRQGFQLDGAQQVKCGSDGRWQPQLPQCLPLPEDKTEHRPVNKRPHTTEQPQTTEPSTTEQPHITERSSTAEQPSMKDGGCRAPQPASGSNTRLTDMYMTMRSFANGDKVKYQCQVGYVAIGGSRYSSCKNGQWSTQNLRCKPKSCGTAGEIYNGEFIYNGSEFGATATAVCDEGYRLVGRATRNCQDGGWDGRVPACEAMECEDPPATNAEMMDIREFYTYNAVVRYRCRSGTLVGQQSIWCTKDGTWSSPPPKCQVMTCPPPNVANASWRAPHDHHQYRYKETISVACHSGYTMTGPNVITCESDGQWSRRPTCSPIVKTCPPPNVANAYWMPPHNQYQYQYKETISVACYGGYIMTGPDVITCESDGQWSRLPTCTHSYYYNNYYNNNNRVWRY